MDTDNALRIEKSKDKVCGICFQKTKKRKNSRQRRFGILPNCNHSFCLSCIRKWRKSKMFPNDVVKSCPMCRIKSDYICASTYFVDNKEEKKELFDNYKMAVKTKPCKYFTRKQTCPFGYRCFYQHQPKEQLGGIISGDDYQVGGLMTCLFFYCIFALIICEVFDIY